MRQTESKSSRRIEHNILPKPERWISLGEHVKVDLESLEAYSKHDLEIRYGSLPPDHAAYAAAAAALQACRKPAPQDITLMVCPRMPANAMAIGRDIVAISANLMLECQSHEGLRGILGHELNHLEAQDTVRSLPQLPADSNLGTILEHHLKTTSIARLAEHQSDIDGASRKLDAAGTNPLGYVVELEAMAEREQAVERERKQRGKRPRRTHDVVHGKTLDRALLGRVAWRYIDMANLSQDLTPITEAERVAWQTEPAAQYLTTAPLFEPYTTFSEFKFKEKWPDWVNRLKQLDPKQRAITLHSLIQHWQTLPLPGIDMPAADAFFAEVQRLLEQDTAGLGDNPRDVALRRFLHYQLNLGLKLDMSRRDHFYNPLPLEQPYTHLHRVANYAGMAALKTIDDSRYLREQLPRILQEQLPYSLGDVRDCLHLILKQALDAQWFGSLHQPEQFNLPGFLQELEAWSQALADFAKHRSIVQPDAATLFMDGVTDMQAAGNRYGRETGRWLDNRVHAALIDHPLFIGQVETKRRSITYRQWEESAAGIKFLTSIQEKRLQFGEISKQAIAILETEAKNYTIKEVGWLLQSLTIQLDLILSDYNINTTRIQGVVATFNQLEQWYARWLATDPRAAGSTNPERSALKFLYKSHSFKMFKFWDQGNRKKYRLPISPTLTAYLAETANNEANAIRLARLLLTDGADFGQDAPPDIKGKIDIEFGVRWLAAHLIQVPIHQRWATIQRYEAAHVPVLESLKKNPVAASPLLADIMQQLSQVRKLTDRLSLLNLASDCCYDPQLKVQLQQAAVAEQWRKARSFEEQLTAAFDQPASRYALELKDRLIEEEMVTAKQYIAVSAKFHDQLSAFFAEGNTELGGLAEIDQLLQTQNKTAFDLIKVCLGTRHNDAELRRQLVEIAKVRQDSGKEWRLGLAQLDQTLTLLLSLTEHEKIAITKKLIIDSGIMETPADRTQLFHTLLTEAITHNPSETDVRHTLKQVMTALGAAEDWKLLFLSIAPTLANQLLIPPAEGTPWIEIDALGGLDPDEEDYLNQDFQIPKDKTTAQSWKYEPQYNVAFTRSVRSWLNRHGQGTVEKPKRKTPLELVTEIAPRAGSLAVRFLQLLPQFVNIPERYQAEFNHLLDGLRGQSKFTSIGVVAREWPAELGDMWETIDHFGKRLGGGSLMTVYEIHTKKSASPEPDKVIRVRNPNIQFHLEATRALFENTLDIMLQQGSLDAATHGQLLTGVDLVSEWIEQELKFDEFLEKDAEFYAAEHGFGAADQMAYTIKVPKSEPPISRYFQIEEKVTGRNLTEWDQLVAEGHNMQDVVRTICRSFAHQITSGRLHGDVHIGNYRVTPDKQVAILDRTFFIDLTEPERALFGDLIRGQVDPAALLEYLSQFMPSDLDASTITPIIMELGNNLLAGNAAMVNQGLVALRQHGVGLPLHLSLLTRNVHAYDQLAKRAGLNSLQEAVS